MAASRPDTTPRYGTVPQAARRYGLGLRLLRRLVREGTIPAYSAGTQRPRVCYSEVEAWLRSTRLQTTDHARARIAELEAQGRLGAGRR